MKYKFILLILFALLAVTRAAAQDKPTVVILGGRDKIRISIDTTKPVSTDFARNFAEKIDSYDLHEVRDVEDVRREIVAQLEKELPQINAISDPAMRAVAMDKLIAEVGKPPANLVNTQTQPVVRLGGERITLTLNRELDYGKTYKLTIAGLGAQPSPPPGGKPQLRIATNGNAAAPDIPKTSVNFDVAAEPSADLLPSGNAFDQTQARIVSKGPLVSATDPSVNVERRTLKIKPDLSGVEAHFEPITATIVEDESRRPNDLTLALGSKLSGGRAYNLVVRSGLSDGTRRVNVKGTIKFPGAPAPPPNPKIDLTFSSLAAVGQKAVLNFAGKLMPINPVFINHSWRWEPRAEVDVGLRSTKSNNSIILQSPFTKKLIGFNTASPPPGSTIPSYAGWARASWLSPSDIKISIGPKLETDRKFQRINTLGSLRFDFNFYRWLGSIKAKRELLKLDLKSDADLVEINRGLEILPYLSFDFGAHANNETVTNSKKKVSVIVPRHKIFRSYAGVISTFEWQMFSLPMSLTLDESLVHLATRERTGFTTDTGVELRQLSGVHPHSKVTWNISFDPARHYSFAVIYENGRLAPNFEYLNKLSAGIRVLF